MATITEVAPKVSTADAPFDLTIDVFSQMVEAGLIPHDRRVFLRDGRLYEKMAKTKSAWFDRRRDQHEPGAANAARLEPLAREHDRPGPHRRPACRISR